MTQQLTIEQLKFARSIGATHYDWEDGKYRKDGYIHVENEWECGLSGNCYREYHAIQLLDFSTLDELEPEYVPKVGEECELYTDVHGWIEAKYVGKDGESPVFRLKEPTDRGIEAVYMVCIGCKFRPLPDPAQQRREELLEKWRSQGLEYAHDTERTRVGLGAVFDFIADLEGE